MALIVILLGAPGAGKGTQAVRLAAARSLPHVSTGDLLRDNRARGTPLGREAQGYMDRGELVPDALVLDMLAARVAASDCKEGYVLDGFPRTEVQAQARCSCSTSRSPTKASWRVPPVVSPAPSADGSTTSRTPPPR
jgi:adenylate kinase family enzyme